MTVRSTSWAPIALDEVLAGGAVGPRPTMLRRGDDVALLHPGELHMVIGEAESAKGWLALAAVAEQLAAGRRVLYVDWEDCAANVIGRLVALGVAPDAIRGLFAYTRPDEPLTEHAWRDLQPALAARPSLVIADGLTEAFSLQGLDPDSNRQAAESIPPDDHARRWRHGHDPGGEHQAARVHSPEGTTQLRFESGGESAAAIGQLAARVTKIAPEQVFAASASGAVEFDTARFIFTTPDQLTVPAGADGTHLIRTQIATSQTGGSRVLIIMKNGTVELARQTFPTSLGTLNMATLEDLVAGDVISVHDSNPGSGEATMTISDPRSPVLSIARV